MRCLFSSHTHGLFCLPPFVSGRWAANYKKLLPNDSCLIHLDRQRWAWCKAWMSADCSKPNNVTPSTIRSYGTGCTVQQLDTLHCWAVGKYKLSSWLLGLAVQMSTDCCCTPSSQSSSEVSSMGTLDIVASQKGLVWKGLQRSPSSTSLLWAGLQLLDQVLHQAAQGPTSLALSTWRDGDTFRDGKKIKQDFTSRFQS